MPTETTLSDGEEFIANNHATGGPSAGARLCVTCGVWYAVNRTGCPLCRLLAAYNLHEHGDAASERLYIS